MDSLRNFAFALFVPMHMPTRKRFTRAPIVGYLCLVIVTFSVDSILAQPVRSRVDVGGRSVLLECQGAGSPTVVVDAGMGTGPTEDPAWRSIAAKVAAVTRVCLYDRAGLGGSDPNPKSILTSADAANDEALALQASGTPGPFVLVGHSVGGLHAQVFAARFPAKVAGLVLVSTTHPDQLKIWADLLPAATQGEAKEITDARAFLAEMQSDPAKNPERLDFSKSAEQARQLHSMGAKPVIILTHSPSFRMVPGLVEPLAIKLEDATQAMQKQYLHLSSNATQHIAATAGHHLPDEAPDFVTAGILEAVRDVRR